MCSDLGVSVEKILALDDYVESALYSDEEKTVLAFADAMTLSDRDVSDDLFSRLRGFFDEDQVVELTAAIAWENASSKFNRALRVESQQLWSEDPERL